MTSLRQLVINITTYFRALIYRELINLYIRRKYQDANGNYIGELYADDVTIKGKKVTAMIGVSLDSLDFGDIFGIPNELDLRHDFLAYMPKDRIRLGSLEPKDNDQVRNRYRFYPSHLIRIHVQNCFIESILEESNSR